MFLDGLDPDLLRLLAPPVLAAVVAIVVGTCVLAWLVGRRLRAVSSALDVPPHRPCDGIADRIRPAVDPVRDVRAGESRVASFAGPAAKGFRRDPVIGRDVVVGERRVRIAALNRRR